MPAIKLQKFLGKAPRISGELLPESVAQAAVNTTFFSGDIFPYYQPSVEATLEKTPPILSLYKMESAGVHYWLHWTTDVDVARAPIENDTTQRIYYTGSGAPKVTNFSLATTAGTNYPVDYYTLGLPVPTVAPGLADGGGGAGVAFDTAYVYTYVTDWEEESPPSPATSIARQEGDTINVSNLPKTATIPAGDYNITKFRLYRTVSGTIGSVYYEVAEITIGAATDTYADVISNTVLINTGLSLNSTNYDAPESTMQGIVNFPNGILVGFFGNQLCFSEPFQPHAWPTDYRLTLDWNIVAIAVVGTSVICATEGNPTIVSGNHPASMTQSRIDIIYPCVSKRSMVNMGWGAVYASNAGLVMIGIGGNDLITKQVHYWDTWQDINITGISAKYFDNKYFASFGSGSFIFERDDQIGGHFTDISYVWSGAFYDHLNAKFYFTSGATLYLWNDEDEPLAEADWKSKVFKLKKAANLGAARVIADFNELDVAAAAANVIIAAANAALFAAGNVKGAWNSKAYNVGHAFNESDVQPIQSVGGVITFQLFADKVLVFQRDVIDDSVFRLPAGYKTDTYECRVTGKSRIRAIHLAETPLGLKAV